MESNATQAELCTADGPIRTRNKRLHEPIGIHNGLRSLLCAALIGCTAFAVGVVGNTMPLAHADAAVDTAVCEKNGRTQYNACKLWLSLAVSTKNNGCQERYNLLLKECRDDTNDAIPLIRVSIEGHGHLASTVVPDSRYASGQTSLGFLRKAPVSGGRTLYQCSIPVGSGKYDAYLSSSTSCRGGTFHGVVGYGVPRDDASASDLYSCNAASSVITDRFASVDTDCEGETKISYLASVVDSSGTGTGSGGIAYTRCTDPSNQECCDTSDQCSSDGDVCTLEICSGVGGICETLPFDNCCQSDADCSDGKTCDRKECVGDDSNNFDNTDTQQSNNTTNTTTGGGDSTGTGTEAAATETTGGGRAVGCNASANHQEHEPLMLMFAISLMVGVCSRRRLRS